MKRGEGLSSVAFGFALGGVHFLSASTFRLPHSGFKKGLDWQSNTFLSVLTRKISYKAGKYSMELRADEPYQWSFYLPKYKVKY